jgi:hypothetical protein
MWPKVGVVLATAALLSAVGVTTVNGASAGPTTQCRTLKGTITITGTGAPGEEVFTGKATGSLAGTLSGITATNQFVGDSILTTWSFAITDRSGVTASYVMNVLGTNFTATALVGGGLLSELSLPEGTFSAIHVTLGPQDDSPDGAQPDVFTYAGQRCPEI